MKLNTINETTITSFVFYLPIGSAQVEYPVEVKNTKYSSVNNKA